MGNDAYDYVLFLLRLESFNFLLLVEWFKEIRSLILLVLVQFTLDIPSHPFFPLSVSFISFLDINLCPNRATSCEMRQSVVSREYCHTPFIFLRVHFLVPTFLPYTAFIDSISTANVSMISHSLFVYPNNGRWINTDRGTFSFQMFSYIPSNNYYEQLRIIS